MPDAFIPKDRTQRIQKPIKPIQPSSASASVPASAYFASSRMFQAPCASALRFFSWVFGIIGAVSALFVIFNPLLAIGVLMGFALIVVLLRAAAAVVQSLAESVALLADMRKTINTISKSSASADLGADQCRIALSGMDDTLDQILAAVTPAPAPKEAAPQAPAE